MNWTVEKAEKNFSGLLLEAGYKPQPVFDNNQLIAAVIDAKTFREFERWQNQRKRKSLASAFEELRQLCSEEDYKLEIPNRSDRENAFLGDL